MKDVTIILQGVVNSHQLEMWKKNHKNSKVIISTWEDCDFDFGGIITNWLPSKWKVIKTQYPFIRFATGGNLDYQIISTLKALQLVDTEWVIKMRADEYWSNLDKIFDKMKSNPHKIVSGSMFFREWGMYPFHCGDKILGGTLDNITLMFESTLQNLQMNLWKGAVPESQLGLGYVMANDSSLESKYVGEQLHFQFNKGKNSINTTESITSAIYKALGVTNQKVFEIMANSTKDINLDDVKSELDYIINVLNNVSSHIAEFKFKPLDDVPYMKRWFDIIDINELKPYVATRSLGKGGRLWYNSDFDNKKENCLTSINE